jgi:hypothetical protein
MRKLTLAVLFVFALGILLGAASVALGDWDPGDPHKMHYPQLPKTGGFDVAFNQGRLADDWQCSKSGLVEDIHFWISWEMNAVGTISGFTIRIWSDDPCGPGGYSQPDVLLWERDFDAGQFTIRDMPDDLQGWFDPINDVWWTNDHYRWQQINITGINNPFVQIKGEVYWLEVDMWGATDCGWKESGSPHFRDDAVYRQSGWRELKDPNNGQSMDLAFVITGAEDPNIKWIQPPDPEYCGLHAHDYDSAGYERLILADDWQCEGGVVTDLHWWGAIEDYGAGLMGFHLSIHANSDPCCLPLDPALWEADIPISSITATPTGIINSCGEEIIKYEYYLSETEYFNQETGQTYWFDVCALSNDPLNSPCLWKWQEYGRNPVPILCPAANKIWPNPDVWSSIDWGEEYSDMAFVITSQGIELKPLVPNLKWSQPPIPIDPTSPTPTYCGWDEISYNKDYDDPNGPWKIVADDFYCLGPIPIDSLHWWGSHHDWENPQQPPPNPDLPVAWWIGFWSNTYTTGTGTMADVLFLTDTTGSMSGYINNFKTALNGILTAINNAAPGLNIMYSVADYRNFTDGGNYQTFGVNLIQPFTSNTALVNAAINGMNASGGADWAESHLKGMVNIAANWTTPAGPIGFNGRAGAKKIIIWAGDAHGHISGDEPGSSGPPPAGYYPTLNATINALTGQNIMVFGLNAKDCSSGINLPYGGLYNQTPQRQQADDITSATGGTLFCSVGTGGPSIEDAIVDAVIGTVVYSSPEVLLHSFTVPAPRVQVTQVGTDYYYGYYPADVCYQYYVDLEPDEIFWQDLYRDQTLNDIFWLSIVALYPDPCEPPTHPWGWKTRPWSWEDDAARFNVWDEPYVGSSVDPNDVEPIKDPMFEESFDVSFELDTDPNWIKWEQPFTDIREWPHYEDELSMAFTGEEEPATKYIQYPDLGDYTGMDVLAGPRLPDPCGTGVYEKFLADDFLCTMTGPITDIHLWASYNEDMKPPDANDLPWFSLVIYENIPAGVNDIPYSRPGAVLWDAYMQPTVELEYASAEEFFYDPNPDEIIGMDWTVWRYNFDIEPNDAFIQQEGNIYWLGVHYSFDLNGDGVINMLDLILLRNIWPGAFGWKTSLDHFEDDAVWTDVDTWASDPHVVPSGEIWNELRYPMGHQFEGESIDLAFEITTKVSEVEHIVADDWPCESKTPVIAVVWWGSYIGYGFEACSYGPWMTLPVSPDYFRLGIWTDTPALPFDPQSYSHPNDLIWQYDANDYTEVLVGYDKHPHGEPNEPVFRYSVRLPYEEWFLQREVNDIYWLSIEAVYESREPIYNWGWTNHKHVFMDNAVQGHTNPTGTIMWQPLYDQTDETEDMSFILFTWGGPQCWTWPGQCHGDTVGNDLVVDLSDFLAFKNAFGHNYPNPKYDPCADYDRNGQIDLSDFLIFKNAFKTGTVPGDCPPGGKWPP